MYRKLTNVLRTPHKGQRGITGLETAIILIAFVTVASVLAYSVLSAGIFSAERGKETVYGGLRGAQSTMEIKGSVIGISENQTKLENIQFTLGLAIVGSKVDLNTMVINYWDDTVNSENITWTKVLNSTERGTLNMLEGDEQMVIDATLPASANVAAYDTFYIQVIPASGSSITIKRSMPGAIDKRITLD